MDPITAKLMSAAGGAAGDPGYADDVFITYLYNGNAQNSHSINNGIDMAGEGGLTWIKGRTSAGGSSGFGGSIHHFLYDNVQAPRLLVSDLTEASSNYGAGNSGGFSFTSTGFQVGYNGYNDLNYSGSKYVSWSFRKAPGWFDVVSYTGDGNASKTISHSLGSTPGFIIVKRTDAAGPWQCFHTSLGNQHYIQLNGASGASTLGSTVWGVSSTDFTVYGAATDTNISSASYIAYVFADDDASFGTAGNESIIKCGSFTADGSGNGPFQNLGWEPQFVIQKVTSTSGSWYITDTMRGMSKSGTQLLSADASSAEGTETTEFVSLSANGFTPVNNLMPANADCIYMAIRRPHKPPSAATEVFNPILADTPRTAAQRPEKVDM